MQDRLRQQENFDEILLGLSWKLKEDMKVCFELVVFVLFGSS